MFDLGGKSALVTGASSGIGEASALELARLGAAVALVARRTDRLERLSQRNEDEGGRALVLRADIGSQQEAEGAVARPVEQWADSTRSSTTPA